jgi:hypothetical protein
VVFAVAHEHERRPDLAGDPAGRHADAHAAVQPPDTRKGQRQRHPPPASLVLAFLAVVHERRIQPDAGVVDEDAAVDLAHVDAGGVAAGDDGRRAGDI